MEANESFGLVRTEAKNKKRSLSEAKAFVEKRVRETFDKFKVLSITRCEYLKYDEQDDKYEFEVDILVLEKII